MSIAKAHKYQERQQQARVNMARAKDILTKIHKKALDEIENIYNAEIVAARKEFDAE